MPKENGPQSSNYSPSLGTSTPTREVEIFRELSRADVIARDMAPLLELLEKRLAPVLRAEPDGKDVEGSTSPSQTSLGQMLSDISASGIRNNARIQSILSRLEL
jgi:hypothetical protein